VPSLPANWTVSNLFRLISYAICYVNLVILALINWHGMLFKDEDLRGFTNTISNFLNYPLAYFFELPSTRVGDIWANFTEDILVPLFGAVGTMTTDDVYSTPVKPLLEYIHSTVGTWHYTLGDGHTARDVAESLAEPVRSQDGEEDYLRLGTWIMDMEVGKEGTVRLRMSDGAVLEVSRVVLATQASAAGVMLGMAENAMRGVEGYEGELGRVRRMGRGVKEVDYRVSLITCCECLSTDIPSAGNDSGNSSRLERPTARRRSTGDQPSHTNPFLKHEIRSPIICT
jgi:hypothetical protein